ncbi:MAG: SDR family oxidoreductase [Anaerolineales bacterium]|nr:SDR family oxidoreductase [Anaerolineales bacterium]
MNQLDGKVAVVTGAAQGIGLGIARALLSAGAAVVISDVNGTEGERVVAELVATDGRVAFCQTDVADDSAVANLIEFAVVHFGRLDIVVNNAGVVAVQTVEEASVADWDRVMAVNVRSIFLTPKYALPHLRRAGGGAILNVASVSSFFGQQHTPAYVASKGAALMLTKSLAVDYGPEHIRVNALCPGITDTPCCAIMRGHG